jgi:hypothetical protein
VWLFIKIAGDSGGIDCACEIERQRDRLANGLSILLETYEVALAESGNVEPSRNRVFVAVLPKAAPQEPPAICRRSR